MMATFDKIPLNSKYRPIFISESDRTAYVKTGEDCAMLHYGDGQARDDRTIRFNEDHRVIVHSAIMSETV